MELSDHIYSQDNARSPANLSVQWKGTTVCGDVQCICGHQEHVDEDFFFAWECKGCGAAFAVGTNIRLIPLETGKERDYFEAQLGPEMPQVDGDA